MYVMWYGLGRGFTELLRTDSLYVFEVIKLNSVIGFLTCLAGIIGFVLLYAKSKKENAELENYQTAFAGVEVNTVTEEKEEATETTEEQEESNDGSDT